MGLEVDWTKILRVRKPYLTDTGRHWMDAGLQYQLMYEKG